MAGLSALLVPNLAHAYIDPGTGSMALQLLMAGILGALFTIKSYWNELKSFLARMFQRGPK